MRKALILTMALVATSGCNKVKHQLVQWFTPEYKAAGDPTDLQPTFEGADAVRPRIKIRLLEIAKGFVQPTDIQFPPGDDETLVVLEKTGTAYWVARTGQERGEIFKVTVNTDSEAGLLGLAFHPKFTHNGKFYVNSTPVERGRLLTRISEWSVAPGRVRMAARQEHVLLEVEQPYPNHNAGQLAFGPDGYLYIPLGDGGWRGDPHENAQNPGVLLGKFLRIDIDRPAQSRAYGIPPDNPFIANHGYRPEIWALGLRNPWRFSFDPHDRLIVADVGQDKWEEIDIVTRGGNYGWDEREATHCYEPEMGCKREGYIDPVYEYGHDEGQSVTGGFVYTGRALPALAGKYVFGDFVAGRIWAFDLPADGQRVQKVYALGRWPLLISTFGRDASGELYVADFGLGGIYRLAPP